VATSIAVAPVKIRDPGIVGETTPISRPKRFH
jgi:hypothetical protein